MPRVARKKSEESMYHIMSRSISEINLYQCNEDKDYYLKLLKRYKQKYHCRIYAYCLMDNHVHIYINPCGADISSFMQSLNTAYVIYYNKKHKRHGHLFQGRFASTIVNNDTYSLTLSAYIHNNAKDIPGFDGKEELYKYSSYGIYSGIRKDDEGIIDSEFLLSYFSSDQNKARQKYIAFVSSMRDTGIMNDVHENIMRAYVENEYRSEKCYIARNKTTYEILHKIEKALDERMPEGLRFKYCREMSKVKAFVVYTLRILCGYTYKNLCKYIGNMSVSGISRLSTQGFKLIKEHSIYKDTFYSLIQV